MKDLTFKAKPSMVATFGKEWGGTYTIRQLNAVEYLQIGDECIDELRKQAEKEGRKKPISEIPPSLFNITLLKKALLHNGKPIKTFPNPAGKFVELFIAHALLLNTLTPAERSEHFLESETDDQQPQDSS